MQSKGQEASPTPQFKSINSSALSFLDSPTLISILTHSLDFLQLPRYIGRQPKDSETSAAAAKSLQSCPTLRPHRWQHTRLPRPWGSPGKNTGLGCHFLLQCMKVKSESEDAQSCPIQQPHGLQPTRLLHHGIFLARALEWGAIAFSDCPHYYTLICQIGCCCLVAKSCL